MSWQSTPSGEQWIERDDDVSGGPLAPTVPEKPVPGERFMEKGPCGIWAVLDWEAACSRCGGCGVDRPGSNCPCDPSDQVFEPYEVAGGLSEADARLLAFGARDLAGARADAHLLRELLATVHGDGGHYAAEHGTAKATADAITRVVALAALGRGDGEGVAW